MWYPPGQLSVQLVPNGWVLLSHVLGKYEPTEGLGSAGHVISGTVNNKSYFAINFFNFLIQLPHVYSKEPKSVLIFFLTCGLSQQR